MLTDTLPLEPTREQAQRWAVEELARPEYQAQRPGLVERALSAVRDWFGGLDLPQGSGSAVLFTVLVCAVAVLLVLAVRRVGLAARRGRAAETPVLRDVTEDADQLREKAEAFAVRAAWSEAVVARFRAIARHLETRGASPGGAVVPAMPGRTATELAAAAAQVRPDLGDGLRTAAVTFDEVAYGHRAVTEADYDRMAELDDAVRAAPRPTAGVTR